MIYRHFGQLIGGWTSGVIWCSRSSAWVLCFFCSYCLFLFLVCGLICTFDATRHPTSSVRALVYSSGEPILDSANIHYDEGSSSSTNTNTVSSDRSIEFLFPSVSVGDSPWVIWDRSSRLPGRRRWTPNPNPSIISTGKWLWAFWLVNVEASYCAVRIESYAFVASWRKQPQPMRSPWCQHFMPIITPFTCMGVPWSHHLRVWASHVTRRRLCS